VSDILSKPETLLPGDLDAAPMPSLTWSQQAQALLRPKRSIVALAWVVRFSALLNLGASLLHHRVKLVHWLAPWVPFEISEGRRVLMFLTSVLLFILAAGLVRRKRKAWLWTIAALVFAPLSHLGRALLWPQILINLALVGFLLHQRSYFTAGSDPKYNRSALVICPLLAIALLAFGTVRLHELRDQTSGDDDWGSCLQTAVELILVQNTATQTALTIPMLHFFSLLRIGGTSIALLGLFLTLRPVLLRRRVRVGDRETVRLLIDRYGDDSFDSYALLPDKSYFFSANHYIVIPYAVTGNFAVALADPIGHPAFLPAAIAEFTLFCREQDWEPVFYAVTRERISHYEQAGFSVFKIGEEARLEADGFHLTGNDFQNLRTACNKARKTGLRFRWYHPSQGPDEVLERQLESISAQWLETKKDQEMLFDMGSFSLETIRSDGAAVAIDSGGKALAFATWRPFAQGNGRSLDLMRTLPGARNIMDFILVESIALFRAQGISDIDLGLAPLANTASDDSRLLAEEKAVKFLFENLNRIYGYKSLFEFKRKYRPQWRGRYVAYRRGVHLPLVGLALVRVHAPQGLWKLIFG
jgi:lysylphosphatidylglycerol synthetase-like protein (DUF2156 family)